MKKGGYLSDSDYNFIYSKSPRVCVDLVIKKGKRFFLIKREAQPYKGLYHLPGGRIIFRESVLDAIQRIAKTEIGCGVTVKKMIGWMQFLRERKSGSPRHSISICYLVSPKNKLKLMDLSNEKIIHPVHLKFLKSL